MERPTIDDNDRSRLGLQQLTGSLVDGWLPGMIDGPPARSRRPTRP